jgi:hypothetical protein
MTAELGAVPSPEAQPISGPPPDGGLKVSGHLILAPRRMYLFFLGGVFVFVSAIPLVAPDARTVQGVATALAVAAMGLLAWRLCLYRALAVLSPQGVASDFLHAWRFLPWSDVTTVIDLGPFPGPFANWTFTSQTGTPVVIPISWSNIRRQDVRDYIHKYRPDLKTP